MKTYKSKSGKTYTKKQICEAIAYWEKQLNESEKSDAYEISCMNRIADYIVANFGVSRERIYISNSIANGKRLSPLLTTKQLAYVDKPIYAKNAPKDELQQKNAERRQTIGHGMFIDNIKRIVPNFEDYEWFLFHTGYSNQNSDILVLKQNIYSNNTNEWFAFQSIEIKKNKSSYLFQPQFTYDTYPYNRARNTRDPIVDITGMTHAYLSQFNMATKHLQDVFLTAIHNSPQFAELQKICRNMTLDTRTFLEEFVKTHGNYLMKGIVLSNVEDIMKTYFFDAYDLHRQVSVMQIGSGKNARLYKVQNVKSTSLTDPLELLKGKTNAFSSSFNSVILDIEIRKMPGNKDYKLYGKLRFSNKNATITGSFDPEAQLPA